MDKTDPSIEIEDIEKWRWTFIEQRADFILLDGWVGLPARERIQRAIDKGWLVFDKKTSEIQSDSQYTAQCYRPTDKLRSVIAEFVQQGEV